MCNKTTILDYKKVFYINHNSINLIDDYILMNDRKVANVYVVEIYIFLNIIVYDQMNLKDI